MLTNYGTFDIGDGKRPFSLRDPVIALPLAQFEIDQDAVFVTDQESAHYKDSDIPPIDCGSGIIVFRGDKKGCDEVSARGGIYLKEARSSHREFSLFDHQEGYADSAISCSHSIRVSKNFARGRYYTGGYVYCIYLPHGTYDALPSNIDGYQECEIVTEKVELEQILFARKVNADGNFVDGLLLNRGCISLEDSAIENARNIMLGYAHPRVQKVSACCFPRYGAA